MRTCSTDSLTASSANKLSAYSVNSVNKNLLTLPPFRPMPIVESDVSLMRLYILVRVLLTCIEPGHCEFGTCCVKTIPGTCVQYPGLQGGGALGDALTPGTPAGSIAASAHGGTYSYVAVEGGALGGERGAASATAAAAAHAGVARRPLARPSLRRAAHLRKAGRAANTAHGQAGGTDRRATRRL